MKNITSKLINSKKKEFVLSEMIETAFSKLTENACSKCLFFGFYEVEIPIEIIKCKGKIK